MARTRNLQAQQGRTLTRAARKAAHRTQARKYASTLFAVVLAISMTLPTPALAVISDGGGQLSSSTSATQAANTAKTASEKLGALLDDTSSASEAVSSTSEASSSTSEATPSTSEPTSNNQISAQVDQSAGFAQSAAAIPMPSADFWVPSPSDRRQAQQIDSHAESYIEGECIVVYEQETDAHKALFDAAMRYSNGQADLVAGPEAEQQDEGALEGGAAAVHVNLPEGMSVGEAVVRARANPSVAYAQPNYRYYLEDVSAPYTIGLRSGALSDDIPVNDPAAGRKQNSSTAQAQWWLYAVGAFDAWEQVHVDGRVTVAVLDTGTNFEHEDLVNITDSEHAYDAVEDSPLETSITLSELGHGSHVAGIVAGEANNGKGIAGITYNATVLPIAVFTMQYDPEKMREVAWTTDGTLMRAYAYLASDPDADGQSIAQETNTRVINMSLGGYLDEDEEIDYAFEEVIATAEKSGILTVAAGGNGDEYGARTDAHYPSDFDEVMAVTALQDDTTRASFSDYNSHKNIAAPGANVYSTWWSGPNRYYTSNGTSMASPIVAGCAALLWAYDPDLSVSDVKDALYSTAVDLGTPGRDAKYGYGRVNPAAAIESLGNVHVVGQRQQVRTQTQRLSATMIAESGLRDEGYTWAWSVDDETVARIDQDGVFVALSPGSVNVHVHAMENPDVWGHATITVSDIAIPGKISVAPSQKEDVATVRWPAAEGAVEYQVYRSSDNGNTYQLVGTMPADGTTQTYRFSDSTVAGGNSYVYRVLPRGVLDGDTVEGAWSDTERIDFVSKTKLRLLIEHAQQLGSETRKSADGLDVPAAEFWADPASFSRLNNMLSAATDTYTYSKEGQARIDETAELLQQAIDAFLASRKKGTKPLPDSGTGSNTENPGSGSGSDAGSESPATNGGGSATNGGSGTSTPAQPTRPGTSQTVKAIPVYRLYNPKSGVHHYTTDANERKVLTAKHGWKYEGVGWNAPSASTTPVFRLYNPKSGEHLYTTDANERKVLTSQHGWKYEGIGWYSDDAKGKKVERLYNRFVLVAASHHYTLDSNEVKVLSSKHRWKDEGVAWYGLAV